MTIELKPFDAAAYLDNDEAIAAYLESALEDGDGADFIAALSVVARAKGTAGVIRPAPESLSDLGRPDFAVIKHLLASLGMSLHVAPTRAIDTTPSGSASANRETALD